MVLSGSRAGEKLSRILLNVFESMPRVPLVGFELSSGSGLISSIDDILVRCPTGDSDTGLLATK